MSNLIGRVAVVKDGLVTRFISIQGRLGNGESLVYLGQSDNPVIGDIWDGSKFVVNPDAEKERLLKQQRDLAVMAIKASGDKAETLAALNTAITEINKL